MADPTAASEHRQRSLAAVLLALSFALACLLAFNAHRAASSHRQVAEGVLRDYAALAAEQFARRATVEFGYRGYYPLAAALGRITAEPSTAFPSPETLTAALPEDGRHASELMATLFRVSASGDLELSGTTPSPALRGWLTTELMARVEAAATEKPAPFRVLHQILEGDLASVVVIPSNTSADHVVGFVVDPAASQEWFERAINSGPLLPESLGDGALGGGIDVTVVDPTGRTVWRNTASSRYPSELRAERPFGADYNGVFAGFTAHAAIDPDAADRLVIGGLPRSQLPVIAGLLALTATLTLAATRQLRQEQALARQRRDFVSRVSHELRTPLTQIRMFAETLLLDRVRNADERRRGLQIIDREARRLSSLVDNVLRFERGERGENRVKPTHRDVVPLVREVVDGFAPLSDDGRFEIDADLPERALGMVDGDAVRQILVNLLDNAVKYGPEKQRIEIGAVTNGDRLRLWVDDDGPGIPAARREEVWEPFRRLDGAALSHVAGTGIGLSVVRELVALHHGRAWIEDGSRGGAKFVVDLPGLDGGETT